MTANDFLKENFRYLYDENNSGSEPVTDEVVLVMKEYARKKCEEQRDLCQKVHDEGNPKVRNAPEPTFD